MKTKKDTSKYWIVPGIHVVKTGTKSPVMVVERIDARVRNYPGGPRKHILNGVICSWSIGNKHYRETFQTNELEPAPVS